MKTIIPIHNMLKYILTLCLFMCFCTHLKAQDYCEDNYLLGEMELLLKAEFSIINNMKKSLDEHKTITDNQVDLHIIISKMLNNCTYALNSITINDDSKVFKMNSDKINKIVQISGELNESAYLLTQTKSFDSASHPRDIGYIFSNVSNRFVHVPYFLSNDKSLTKIQMKTWNEYRLILKILFNLEETLRKIALGEDVSLDHLNKQINSLESNNLTSIFMYNHACEERWGAERKNDDMGVKFYNFIYRGLSGQYGSLCDQFIVLKTNKYDELIKKGIRICDDFFEKTGGTDYMIFDNEDEKNRYINALKASGKVIFQTPMK